MISSYQVTIELGIFSIIIVILFTMKLVTQLASIRAAAEMAVVSRICGCIAPPCGCSTKNYFLD